MASGAVHKQSNIATGIFLSVTSYIIFMREDITLGAAIGSLVGTIATPDLDLVVPSNFFSRLPIINFLWMCLWWPYKKMVRHRSFISHSPLVSTIIRLLYMTVWFVAFGAMFGINFGIILDWMVLNWEFCFTLFFCWVVQDLVHLWFDFVV